MAGASTPHGGCASAGLRSDAGVHADITVMVPICPNWTWKVHSYW